MRQRLNIDELEASTKIRAKYLRAIENEEFALLPGPTYVKSFLRTYAEKLGLDPQLLVEEFRAQYEPPEPLDFQPLASPRDARRRPRPPRPPLGAGTAVVLAALALLGFLLVLGLTGDDPDEPEQRVDTGSTRTTPDDQQRRRPRNRNRTPAAPPERVVLRVVPADATYVCVDRGEGQVVFEGILEAPRTFRAPNTLRINLGKRSAELRVNGERIAFEDSPEPIGFAFTRTGGSEQLPEAERPCV